MSAASEVKNPAFHPLGRAGRPVIFCRDRAGAVRALFNVCRHRGAIVCREREGNARQFQCIYHGWTYNTDGSIKGIPGDDAYPPGFDKQGMGLAPVPRLEHYKDFYFLNLDRDAVDLKTYLAGARTTSIWWSISRHPGAEIISGTREYDVKANWKLLVETASTTTTWSTRIRPGSTHAQLRRQRHACQGPHAADQEASARIGNGTHHRQSNYRGRPVARWISVYGEEAKADIDAIRKELVERLGEARAARVADTNRNLCIFPNLVINDGSSVTVRNFIPVGPDHMRVTAWALGPVEETEAQRARRLHAFLTFYGPGGFATPDDVAALELAQQGYAAWREVPWTDLSRGMGSSQEQLATDEGHLRVFWRKWSELMEPRA
jgi:phenylpropionate dioxygenase-like ring-hydroxylating dioxygenase large terminal subunit